MDKALVFPVFWSITLNALRKALAKWGWALGGNYVFFFFDVLPTEVLLCRPIRQMMDHRGQSIGFGFLRVEGEQKQNTAAWVEGYRFTGCRDASVGGYEYAKHQASICCIFGGQLGRVGPRGALQNVTSKSNRTQCMKHLTTRGETRIIRCCLDKDRYGSSQDTTLQGKTRRIPGVVKANAFDTFEFWNPLAVGFKSCSNSAKIDFCRKPDTSIPMYCTCDYVLL